VRRSSPYEPVFKDELDLQFHYGIRAYRILKGHLPIHAPCPKSDAGRDGCVTHQSPKSAGRDGGVLGKYPCPTSDRYDS